MNAIALNVGAIAVPDEADLLERARAGDEHAIDLLVRRHLSDVYAVTYRILGDAQLAEDASQEALINALRGLRSFRGESHFRTWLLRIAVNAAHSMGRRQSRRREVALEGARELVAQQAAASDVVALQDEAQRINEVVAQLPEKQRMAVTLRVQQGLSYQEIGALLDCSEGAARVNYHLGVKRLRELLK